MRDWLTINVEARAHRDEIHETARLQAEAREVVEPLTRDGFLALADRFAAQEREMAAQAAEAGWR